MKIAAIITLYYPGDETIANINSYYDFADKFYVFDNTETGSILKEQLIQKNKVVYYHDGQNEGIAKRLNTAALLALEDGFDWLLMMDQDSAFASSLVKKYMECFSQYPAKNEVALFGVNHEQGVTVDASKCDPAFSDELVTSGTLLNLALFKVIGFFDENLFIDAVDNEYTIRTLIAGYKIIQFRNILLTHQIGAIKNRSSIKTLFLIKKQKILHSPLRLYYIYRNNLYLQKKYENMQVASMKKINASVKAAIKRNLYYGRNFKALIYYLLAAKKDFKNNKMGKFSR